MAKVQLDILLNPALDVAKLNVILKNLKDAMGSKLGSDIKLIDTTKLAAELKNVADETRKADDAAAGLGNTLKNLPSGGGGALASAFGFNQLREAVSAVSDAMTEIVQPGIDFEKSLGEVSAITGLAGPALDKLGDSARDLALKFGTGATDQLKSFQGILSKLGPDMAKDSVAITLLSDNVNLLARAGGIDAATSMTAITDSLLQMGLASGTPAEIAKNSTDAINAMAAAAQVGAAEIPQIGEAMVASGVAAKGANMDMVDLNAAIQVLALGGKTGSEAGNALRNVLGLLQNASGPAAAELKKMGTSSKELGTLLTTQGLDVAMAKLSDGMNKLGSDAERNAALMTIFGMENASAAGILMQNGSKFAEFSEGIKAGMEGQGAAFEQANINMDNSATTIAKMKQVVSDSFITIDQAMGGGITAAVGFAGSMAPLATTMMGMSATVGPLALNLVNKLIPGLVATNAAGTATSISMKALWTAMTGPVGIAIAGIAAIAASVGILKDLFNETAQERLADAQAEQELTQVQIQNAQAKQTQIKSNQDLGQSYIDLANNKNRTKEQDLELANMQVQLQQTYPGVIKGNADLATNVDATAGAIRKQAAETAKLTEDIKKLQAQASAQELKIIDLNLDVDASNIADSVGVLRAAYGSSVDDLIAEYNEKLKNAASPEEAANIASTFQSEFQSQFGKGFEGLDAETQQQFYKMTTGWMANGQKGITEKGAALSKALENAFNVGGKIDVNVLKEFDLQAKSSTASIGDMGLKLIGQGNDAEKVYKKLAIATGLSTVEIKAATEQQKIMNQKALEESVLNAKSGAEKTKSLAALKEQAKLTQEDIDNIEAKVSAGKNLTAEEQRQVNEKRKSLSAMNSIIDRAEEGIELQRLKNAYLSGEKLTHEEIQKVMAGYKSEYQKIVESTGTVWEKWNSVFTLINSGGKAQTATAESTEKAAKTSSKAVESAYEKSEKQYQLAEQRLELDKKIKDIAAENAILDEKREKNSKDEIDDSQRQLDLENDKLKKYLESKNMVSSTSEITITTNAEEKDKIKFTIDQMNANIAEAAKNLKGVKVKIEIGNKNDWDKQMAEDAEKWQKEADDNFAKSTEAKKKAADDIAAKNQKEIDNLQRIADGYLNIVDAAAKAYEAAASAEVNKATEKEIEALDKKYGKLKELSAEEKKYNEERADIERDAAANIMMIQEAARGQRLEAERQMTLVILGQQAIRLKAELALTDQATDPAKYKQLDDALSDVTSKIQTKGDLLLNYGSELSTGLTEAFSNIFADEEAMKAPWKKLFAITVGALKQYASMLVVDMVLKGLEITPGGPLAALIAVPILTGLANALIGAILDPILASVASFATSGVITKPTLAWVGDARKAGSKSNAEVVLNSEVFGDVIDFVLGSYTEILDRYFKAPISYSDGTVNDIDEILAKFNTYIEQLKPYFKEGEYTAENIEKLINSELQKRELIIQYDDNKLSFGDYAAGLNDIQLQMIKYAAPSTFNQELALMADGRLNPAIVMNDPALRDAITQSADRAAGRIEETLWETSKLIRQDLQNFARELFVNQGSVYDGYNKEYNAQNMNVRRKL